MRPAFRILSCRSLNAYIRATRHHLSQLGGHRCNTPQRGIGQRLDPKALRLRIGEAPVVVDENDAGSSIVKTEVCSHLANRTGTPDSNYVAFLHASVYDSVPRRADDIREIEACVFLAKGFQEGVSKRTFLIWDTVWQLQEIDIDIPKRNTDVLRLSTCEATGEMRVSK